MGWLRRPRRALADKIDVQAETDMTASTLVSVRITAKAFFFEPWCSELEFSHPSEVRVAMSPQPDPFLEVDVWDDGDGVSVWLPTSCRVYWRAMKLHATIPVHWQPVGDELEFDYQAGTFVDGSSPSDQSGGSAVEAADSGDDPVARET